VCACAARATERRWRRGLCELTGYAGASPFLVAGLALAPAASLGSASMRGVSLVLVSLGACPWSWACGSAPAPGTAEPPRARPRSRRRFSTAADSWCHPGSRMRRSSIGSSRPSPGQRHVLVSRPRLSFSFRPSRARSTSTSRNLQGRPVQIDWDRSVFYDPRAEREGGNSTLRWRDR